MIDFPAQREKVRAELAGRPPFLGKVFEKFGDRLELRPLRFIELHGAQGLSSSDRKRLEPRLAERRKAMILVAGALLTDMRSAVAVLGQAAQRRRIFGARP